MNLKVVTPQRTVLDIDSVEVVTAPGSEGELGILPHHAPLLTKLNSGIVSYTIGGKKRYLALEGAFMEVAFNQVSILADSAILPEEADARKAQAARARAEEEMKKRLEGTDFQRVEAEMRKALLELKLIEHIK